MHLDDYEHFAQLDQEDMMGQINALPEQLITAWELASRQDIPSWMNVDQVLIAGMGGSAIGADLLASYVGSSCEIPVVVHRDYDLPVWARGQGTLVIASSHSGNTEETLSAFEQALNNRCRILAISTGGELARLANDHGVPMWIFEHAGQPRAAVGYSFGMLLHAFTRLKLIPDPSDELQTAVRQMQEQKQSLREDVPIAQNIAKRLAGQLVGRWVTVIGSGIFSPVARRWKGQISEIAKAWAQFEFLPEADHNTLAGIENPEDVLFNTSVLFLRSPYDHPRNQLRTELTRRVFMVEGLGTEIVDAVGGTPLASQWTCLHLGDYVAYYLAMLYGVDPTPVEAIEGFKRELQVSRS